MAEKSLSQTFGTGVKMELKIGKSFEKKGSSNSVYHTIKYDFKPVSVDENQMGLLEVNENRSVSVALPHLEGTGKTNFKGNAKAANSKECILIIDHETGELTLERLDSQIMLKKTRPEKPDKPLNSNEVKAASNLAASNPFEVREKPLMPKKPPANPFEVLEKPLMPGRPRPHTPQAAPRPQTPQERPSNRPHTPQQKQKKKSPQYSNGMGFKDSLPDMSPLHSNKSSPAWPERSARSSPKRTDVSSLAPPSRVSMGGGVEVDSLGRPLPVSDSSNSSDSSSGSDSDSGPEEDDTANKPAASKQESTHSSKPSLPSSHSSKPSMPSSQSSKASMPGTNLSMPGTNLSMPGAFDMPGDDFSMPGGDFSMPSGVVAKPRPDPQKSRPEISSSDFDPTSRRSRSTKRPTERSSAAQPSRPIPPPAVSRPIPPPAVSRPAPPVPPPHRPTPPSNAGHFSMPGGDFSMPSMSAPTPSMSMPNFADLGDDLALSDSD